MTYPSSGSNPSPNDPGRSIQTSNRTDDGFKSLMLTDERDHGDKRFVAHDDPAAGQSILVREGKPIPAPRWLRLIGPHLLGNPFRKLRNGHPRLVDPCQHDGRILIRGRQAHGSVFLVLLDLPALRDIDGTADRGKTPLRSRRRHPPKRPNPQQKRENDKNKRSPHPKNLLAKRLLAPSFFRSEYHNLTTTVQFPLRGSPPYISRLPANAVSCAPETGHTVQVA